MISNEAFDSALSDLLRTMQEEGKLVTYLEGLGDVMSEIREDLNNEVIKWALDQAETDDDIESMEADLAPDEVRVPDLIDYLSQLGDNAIVSCEDILLYFQERQ